MDRSISYNHDGTVTLREKERELVLDAGASNSEIDAAAVSFFTSDE